MSDQPDNGQPLQNDHQAPPPNVVKEEQEQPVVEPEIDDGYEADDEGPEGWPQDPFEDNNNLSFITQEGDNAEDLQPVPGNINQGDNNENNDN